MSSSSDSPFVRREFLRLLGGAAGLVAAHAAGCGGAPKAAGGGGSLDASTAEAGSSAAREGGQVDAGAARDGSANGGSGEGGPIKRPPIDGAELASSVKAITNFANTLLSETREKRRAALLTFLEERDEILAAGTNDDGIWAIYKSGVPLMILDNREPDAPAPSAAPLVSQRVSDVPKGTRARLINTMGTAFVDETPMARELLTAKGYSVVKDAGSVDSLRTLAGDGVLYFSAHGGLCVIPSFNDKGKVVIGSDGEPVTVLQFGLWTSTPFDENDEDRYLTDLREGTLGLGIALHDYSADKKLVLFGAHYWVTDLWALENWSFSKDGVAWISACQSHSGAAEGFIDACLYGTAKQTKAGLYVGWTASVAGNAALLGARFVLDRMLGANLGAPKEEPPQRSFDYTAVWADLKKRGLHLHPNPSGPGTTELKYTAKTGAKLGLLAPSIAYVLIDEMNDEAILVGSFGTPPESERAVLIGGLETTTTWTATKIRAKLPRTGTGSAGDVLVSVRGHDSNVRRITEWNIQFDYLWQQPELIPCKVDGPVTVRFRADVGDYRKTPGTPPVKNMHYAIPTRDSQATLTGTGASSDGDCTTTYAGQGHLVASGYDETLGAPLILTSWLKVDGATRQASIALALGVAQTTPWTQTIACPDSATVTIEFAVAFGLLQKIDDFASPLEDGTPAPSLSALQVQLDDTWGVPAGTFTDKDTGFPTLTWEAAAAKFPPDPNAAR